MKHLFSTIKTAKKIKPKFKEGIKKMPSFLCILLVEFYTFLLYIENRIFLGGLGNGKRKYK